MSPKDLYYLPQAFIVTSDGSREEFTGITYFGVDPETGVVYDKGMMYEALTQKGGIFKGHMGHPVPSKISEEQIPFYLKQIMGHSNFEKMSPQVKKKVTEGKPWSFDDLKMYVTMVESRPTSRLEHSVGINKNTVEAEGFMRKMKEKDEEIKNLKESLESEKQLVLKMLEGKEGEKRSVEPSEDSKEMMRTLKENQEQLKLNSQKIDKLTKHVEHMVNKKGLFNAFLESYKSPLSGGLDIANIMLTIMGTEGMITAVEKREGPFGEDIKRLRAEGTVNTISLLSTSPSSLVFHLLSKDQPKSSPSAKSTAIIFVDTTELEKNTLSQGAVKFMGGALKTNLSCVVEESLKHYSVVILCIPPAPIDMVDAMNEMMKETIEVPNIVVVNLTNLMDHGKATESGDIEGSIANESPIKTHGWKTTAAISHAVGKAVQILNPECQFNMCPQCWGCHVGECRDITQGAQDSKTRVKRKADEEICLRCLNVHSGRCRKSNLSCEECGDRGHSYKLHEVTDLSLQEQIKTNFGILFEFVTPDQSRRAPGGSKEGRAERGQGGGRWKQSNYQHQSVPRITAVVNK